MDWHDKIILDTNVIISALIKSGITREIILKGSFEFLIPAYTLTEVYKYKELICKKSEISFEEFDELINKLFKYIRVLNPSFYFFYLKKASKLIDDVDDIPFIAAALAFNCPIWSEDKHFQKQKEIKIFTTKEIIGLRNAKL